ncbi:MAG: hypothetical protein ACTSVI_15960 [Promethearchaeota archaeon]
MTQKLPEEGSLVELLIDIPEYNLSKGDKGKILVAYDPYNMSDKGDFEVFFESIDTSVILTQSQFKIIS